MTPKPKECLCDGVSGVWYNPFDQEFKCPVKHSKPKDKAEKSALERAARKFSLEWNWGDPKTNREGRALLVEWLVEKAGVLVRRNIERQIREYAKRSELLTGKGEGKS